MENEIFSIYEASEYLDDLLGSHSVPMMRKLKKLGKLVPFKTPKGGIYYTKYQLDAYIEGTYDLGKEDEYKKDIVCSEYITNKEYSVKEVANILGVSIRTLQRYEKNGILVPFKTDTTVYYTDKMLSAYIDGTYSIENQDEYRNTFIGTPVEIRFDLDRMVKMEDISDESVQYYKIESEFLKTKFDVLEVDCRLNDLKNSFTKRYTLGRIVTENNDLAFEGAITFMGR